MIGENLQLGYAIAMSVCVVVVVALALWREQKTRDQLAKHQRAQRDLSECIVREQSRAEISEETASVLREQLSGAQETRDRLREDLAGIQRVLTGKDAQLLQTTGALKSLESELHEAQLDSKRHEQRLGDNAARIRDLLDKQKELRRSNNANKRNARELEDAIERLSEENKRLQRGQQRWMKQMRALGLPVNPVDCPPLDARSRLATRATLAELRLDTDADAVAIVDAERGLPMLGVGDLAMLDRLGAFSVLWDRLQPVMQVVLGSLPEQIHISDSMLGYHFSALAEPGCYLAVGGPATLASRSLQHARMRLGAWETTLSIVRPTEWLPGEVGSRDEQIERYLCSWQRRWSAHSAAVVDEEGRTLAATGGTAVDTMATARLSLQDFLVRLSRDGIPIDRIDITISGTNGTTASVRMLEDHEECDLVVVVAAQPLPQVALDELTSSLRWKIRRRNVIPCVSAAK